MIKQSILIVVSMWLLSCGSNAVAPRPADTRDSGTITISADESYKPIIDAQIKVFESNNPRTKINVQYKPEELCAQDFWNDSIRMILSTMYLKDAVVRGIEDSLKLTVDQLKIARDAVAVIVHPSSVDSLFTMDEIRSILSGEYSKPYVPVFDGVKATSTVRYILDSVLRGKPLAANAVAARTSDSVINYVATHPGAIGFIGVSWVGNKDDKEQLSFLKKVKMAHLESNDIKNKYILPVQANIYMGRYPMTRSLVYILKEKDRGLGSGFADFLSGEIGQLIFKRAYLMPGRRSFILRPARLNEEKQ